MNLLLWVFDTLLSALVRIWPFALCFLLGAGLATVIAAGGWRAFWVALLLLLLAAMIVVLEGRERARRARPRTQAEWDRDRRLAGLNSGRRVS